jgi:hypothetical protein
MREIKKRREFTTSRVIELRAKLAETENLISGRACVYATGSFGRLEASTHSDLDLFIVGKYQNGKDGKKESMLSRLSEICVKADLIKATRALKISDFDGDGKYLVRHPANLLTATLGKPEDDAINTFTSRLLLLLESHPLVEQTVHGEVINDVIAAYWRDYEERSDQFVPAFLANDILRLWRTFCVNYEVRTERQPEEKKWKRKTKNYKLKFSRLLTCYSALLYLLFIFGNNRTVHPADVLRMVVLSPTQRLETIYAMTSSNEIKSCLEILIDRYDNFLKVTDVPEPDLIKLFSDKKISDQHFAEARDFGTSMFDALNRIGSNSEFHRLLVV